MNALETVNRYVTEAATTLKLDDALTSLLLTPDRQLRVEIPIIRDNGQLQNFIGYRIQHNDSRGPFKGDCDITQRSPTRRSVPSRR